MPFTQKEEGLGQYNSSVQIDNDQSFALVPEYPNLLEVDLPFMQFHTPNVLIRNARDDVVYLVTLQDDQLVIEEVQIGLGEEGRRQRSGRGRDRQRKGPAHRR